MHPEHHRLFRALGGLLLIFSLFRASALEIGVSSVDITPDVAAYQVPLAGYGARKGKPATGVHDPLHAKVLFFRDQGKAMALVTTDLRSVTPQLKELALKAAPRAGLSADTLLLCASHTHDGPSLYPEKFWELQFGKPDPAVISRIGHLIGEALERAAMGAAPARIGIRSEMLNGFSRNRRWNYDVDARKTAGESAALNQVLTVIRVDDLSGNCRAVLAHFATHPTILGASNMLVSAEWPGIVQRELEQAFPGAIALYCNGAEGDQSPDGADGGGEFDRVQRFGKRIADSARKLAGETQTKEHAGVEMIRIRPELPPVQFSPGAQKGIYKAYEPAAREALPRQAEIQLLRIGETILAGLPGEPICDVGVATQQSIQAAGFPNSIVIGLSNDYLGYIVNEKEYAHGGYEVDQRSYYGPGLGAFLAAEAGKAAHRLKKGKIP